MGDQHPRRPVGPGSPYPRGKTLVAAICLLQDAGVVRKHSKGKWMMGRTVVTREKHPPPITHFLSKPP